MIPMDKEMTFPNELVKFPVYQDVTANDALKIEAYLKAIAEHNYLQAGIAL